MTSPGPFLDACHHRLIAWVRARRVLLVALLVLSILLELVLIAAAPHGTVTRNQALQYILPGFLPPFFFLPLWYANWFSAHTQGALHIFKAIFFLLANASVAFVLLMTLFILLRHS